MQWPELALKYSQTGHIEKKIFWIKDFKSEGHLEFWMMWIGFFETKNGNWIELIGELSNVWKFSAIQIFQFNNDVRMKNLTSYNWQNWLEFCILWHVCQIKVNIGKFCVWEKEWSNLFCFFYFPESFFVLYYHLKIPWNYFEEVGSN